MFERISGFFKKFSRRRKQQSGETTIMNGKEPGIDEFGLDDDFGGIDSLDETADTDGLGFDTGPEEAGVGSGLSDFDMEAESTDITTGGSDFDERTVSDEISGGDVGLEESPAGLDEMFPGEAEGVAYAEPKGPSLVKRILILIIALVLAGGAGAAFQIFLWPMISPMVGMASTEPSLDPQTEVNAAQRQKASLQKELSDFRQIGGPAEVKGLQEEIAQVRDTQGSMEEFQKSFDRIKKKEEAYDQLVARIEKIGKETSTIRSEIASLKSEIEKTRNNVVRLARRSEEEYERFRLELVRAELSERLFLELQREDIESFRLQLAELERALSRLSEPDLTTPPAEAASTAD